MGDTHRKRRRVFVEDVRGEGRHLRATWHAERRTFVLSTWIGEVCTGAVRLPVEGAPELVSLIVDGLAEVPPEAADPWPPPVRPPPPPPAAPPDTPAAALGMLRRWLGSRLAGVPLPPSPRAAAARPAAPAVLRPSPPPAADEARRTA